MFSGADGESADLVTRATLGGMQLDNYARLDLWINRDSFRTFVVGSVAGTTKRKLFTFVNLISDRSKRPTITTQSANR